MISISQLAASVLFETLKGSDAQTEQSLRLFKDKKGFTLQIDPRDPV
jgi:hypothetical protein